MTLVSSVNYPGLHRGPPPRHSDAMPRDYTTLVAEPSAALFELTVRIMSGATTPLKTDGSTNSASGRYDVVARSGRIEAPHVSVVIPTFNRHDVLPRAVDSVVQLRDVDAEVVIVEDGGEPLPPKALEELTARGLPVTVARHHRNLGLGAARNTGASLSRGAWLVMLDDDDALTAAGLPTLVGAAHAEPGASFVFGGHVRQWYDGESAGAAEYRMIGYEALDDLAVENPIICGSFMIERRAFAALRGYREDLPVHEDYNLHVRALSAYRPVYVDVPVCTYHCRTALARLNHKRLYWFATSAFNHAVFRVLFGRADDADTKLTQRKNQYAHLARAVAEGCPLDTAWSLVERWWSALRSNGLSSEVKLDEAIITNAHPSLRQRRPSGPKPESPGAVAARAGERMTYPLAVFVPSLGARSETFIRRHVQDLLPGRTVSLGGPLAEGTVRDWDADGPLVDLGAVSNPNTVARWLRDYGVRVLLAEYLDESLPWIDVANDLGIRLFAHAHGYDVSLRLREPRYRREYLRYRDAAGVITMSEASRTRLVELGLPPATTVAIPYGVDVPATFEERPRRPGVTVLAVGRMVAKKAPILTLDAFRQATSSSANLRLDYVGAGPLSPAAAQFVRAFGLEASVTLHGGRPNAFVRDAMSASDVFVQHSVVDPATGDEEGLPVAILEAMAAGLPVVATRHAGIPEAVEDGVTGFLVEEGDTAGMAERLSRLAVDRDLRVAMGRAGWQRAAERFTWDRERDDLLRVLGLRDVTGS